MSKNINRTQAEEILFRVFGTTLPVCELDEATTDFWVLRKDEKGRSYVTLSPAFSFEQKKAVVAGLWDLLKNDVVKGENGGWLTTTLNMAVQDDRLYLDSLDKMSKAWFGVRAAYTQVAEVIAGVREKNAANPHAPVATRQVLTASKLDALAAA